MATFYLVLTWAALGLVVGALGIAAHLTPRSWPRYGWFGLLALGLGAALLGGWLGFWLFGRLFASATALWIAVLVICLPECYRFLSRFAAQARAK